MNQSLCLATYYNYLGPSYFYTLFDQGWMGWGDKNTFPMALKAMNEKYYQIQPEVMTLFSAGSINGIGMLQADPSITKRRTPMFMHLNMIKLSVRRLLCVGCIDDDGSPIISQFENPKSLISSHLREGRRLFGTNELTEHKLDPEPSIWKALEYTACRSVWKTPQLCSDCRTFMSKAFGFKFEGNPANGQEALCVVDP